MHVDEKIDRLKCLSDRLDELEWENLRQKVVLAFDGLLTYSLEPVFIVSPKNRILNLNNRAKNMFGYPEDDVLIKKQFQNLFVHPEDWENSDINHLPGAVSRELVTECRHADGTAFKARLHIFPLIIEQTHILGVIVQIAR